MTFDEWSRLAKGMELGERQTMKIWNTKYALTEGILEQEVRGTSCLDMVEVPRTEKSYSYYLHGEGREWHRTKESAIAKAEQIRTSKIASLEKSLKKMEALKFE